MGEVRAGSIDGRTRRRAAALVVEDDEDLAAVLGEVLDAMGYEVQIARDGQRALDALDREEPEVLVLDIGLPRHDGIAVAQLTRKARGAGLPIIAITGWTAPDLHEAALAAGCDALLVKPFTIEDLREALEEVRARGTRPGDERDEL
jgi:DNA-binding response OmpR family regulator